MEEGGKGGEKGNQGRQFFALLTIVSHCYISLIPIDHFFITKIKFGEWKCEA